MEYTGVGRRSRQSPMVNFCSNRPWSADICLCVSCYLSSSVSVGMYLEESFRRPTKLKAGNFQRRFSSFFQCLWVSASVFPTCRPPVCLTHRYRPTSVVVGRCIPISPDVVRRPSEHNYIFNMPRRAGDCQEWCEGGILFLMRRLSC